MRRLVRIALLVFASATVIATPAIAQPTAPEPCEVRIAHASDEVRATIEQWLVGERCTVPLEVRIVPTTGGGLYLFARDGRGRVRERIVPDAESAGVLVASWAADDGLGPQPEIAPPAPIPVEPAPASGPGATALIDRASPRVQTRGKRWLALAGMQGAGGHGARATVDIAAHGRWKLGAVAAISPSRTFNDNFFAPPPRTTEVIVPWVIGVVDSRALGYVARTFGDGPWRIRPSLGLGLVYTRAGFDAKEGSGWDAMTVHHADGELFPMAEVALTIGHDIGASWGIDLGIVTSLYSGSMVLPDNVIVKHDGTTVELTAGIRYRL